MDSYISYFKYFFIASVATLIGGCAMPLSPSQIAAAEETMTGIDKDLETVCSFDGSPHSAIHDAFTSKGYKRSVSNKKNNETGEEFQRVIYRKYFGDRGLLEDTLLDDFARAPLSTDGVRDASYLTGFETSDFEVCSVTHHHRFLSETSIPKIMTEVQEMLKKNGFSVSEVASSEKSYIFSANKIGDEEYRYIIGALFKKGEVTSTYIIPSRMAVRSVKAKIEKESDGD